MNKLLDKLNMPVGKRAKEKLDQWLNENINEPLAKKGYEDTGAALSAAISSVGEFVIPENLTDVAMSAVPVAKVAKGIGKGLRALKMGEGKIPKLTKFDADVLKQKFDRPEEVQKLKDLAAKSEAEAPTLVYDKFKIKRIPGKKE